MSYTFPEFTPSIVDRGFAPEDADTRKLYNEVEAFARQGQPVVIFGPTGAGKEFLARHYYNTFIHTEFYQQYMENWPSRFDAIKDEYSAFYSGKSLDVFLNSIRAGIFQTINSATIYPNLAESILFGHEANSFTGALTSPGLLESVKYGVLFMDEIGELPKTLQAKLLRAVDSEIYEGRRISGRMNYSLKDLIIISATNQPRDRIRDDFYYKMGIEVSIKGIDERPKDVRKAIPHFIRKAIGKRKDYAAVIHMFGIRGLQSIDKLSDTEEVKNFADEQSGIVIDEILSRKWPGNFRGLRIALESSIFRIISPDHLKPFGREFRENLHHYIGKYSVSSTKTTLMAASSIPGAIFPSTQPVMDRQIHEKISDIKIFPYMSDFEKNVLAVFLSTTSRSGFRRKDLEEFYRSHDNIKHTSQGHIRSKINTLLNLKILHKTGTGKSTQYQITKSFMDQLKRKNEDVFSLPEINPVWADRNAEIEALGRILLTSKRIYIQAPSRYGKSAFISMFCNTFKEKYNFYYYPLGEAGIRKLFEDISMKQMSGKIEFNPGTILDDAINQIHPFLDKIFESDKTVKPVLILDNVHYVPDPEGINTIVRIGKKWQDLNLILIGDTMDNAFLEDYYEFMIEPWSKEA